MTNKYLEKIALNKYEKHLRKNYVPPFYDEEGKNPWTDPGSTRQARTLTKPRPYRTVADKVREFRAHYGPFEGVKKSVSGQTPVPDSYLGHRVKHIVTNKWDNSLYTNSVKELAILEREIHKRLRTGESNSDIRNKFLRARQQVNTQDTKAFHHNREKAQIESHHMGEILRERNGPDPHTFSYEGPKSKPSSSTWQKTKKVLQKVEAEDISRLRKRLGVASAVGAGIGAGYYFYNKNKKDKGSQ